ncbi:hypothetical protein Pcinc_002930 [Petrolisthes cinctipes]|uniref:Uncharacterized protein n=1 Tax=Petrolisthes cinctipes TaxID=88211 RepID=A0AAE1L1S8_PETCI|nr:hypothetical protein Pcinc_002930 [Petrolisthes cinctipes]
MIWTRDTFGWSCKNSSPGDRGGKKEKGWREEEMERHQGVDKENIRGDPDLGARPRQQVKPTKLARDKDLAKRLWEVSEKAVKLRPEEKFC